MYSDVKSSRTSWPRGQNFVLVLVLEDLSSASALALSIVLDMSLNFSFGPYEIVCNASIGNISEFAMVRNQLIVHQHNNCTDICLSSTVQLSIQ